MSRVTSANPFDLLTDGDEDRTVPTPKKEQKPAAPAAKPAAKPAAAKPPAAKPPATQSKAPAKPAENKAKAPTGNSANQVVRPPAPRDANQNLQERDKETRAPRDKRDHPRPPAANKGRAFDRKSGTGRIKNEQSRGGRGRGNWGEVDTKEGVEALKEKETKPEDKEEGDETKEEKPAVEGEAPKEGEAAKEGDAAKDAAPKEEQVFTLDEYLKSRKTKAPQVEALKPRSVQTDFGGFVPLQRDENGTAPLGAKPAEKKEKKSAPAAEKAPTEKKDKDLVAKLLTFASHQDTKRAEAREYRQRNYGERDDRRGSQGDRKGGARNPPRGPRPDNKNATAAGQPPVQEKDFPALGPHGSENPVKA